MIKGGNNAEQQVQKMSIAVDSRNNMLIVRAPDPLFEDVKAMVDDLDQSIGDSPQTTKVVSLQHTNSAAVQKALTSMLGNVKTSTTPAPEPNCSRLRRQTVKQPGQRRRFAGRADAAGHAAQLGNDAGNASHAGAVGRRRWR